MQLFLGQLFHEALIAAVCWCHRRVKDSTGSRVWFGDIKEEKGLACASLTCPRERLVQQDRDFTPQTLGSVPTCNAPEWAQQLGCSPVSGLFGRGSSALLLAHWGHRGQASSGTGSARSHAQHHSDNRNTPPVKLQPRPNSVPKRARF